MRWTFPARAGCADVIAISSETAAIGPSLLLQTAVVSRKFACIDRVWTRWTEPSAALDRLHSAPPPKVPVKPPGGQTACRRHCGHPEKRVRLNRHLAFSHDRCHGEQGSPLPAATTRTPLATLADLAAQDIIDRRGSIDSTRGGRTASARAIATIVSAWVSFAIRPVGGTRRPWRTASVRCNRARTCRLKCRPADCDRQSSHLDWKTHKLQFGTSR